MFNYTHLEDYIKNLYLKIGVDKPKQLNRHTIAPRLGITLYPFNGTSEAVYSNGRQYIFLNSNLTQQEQWTEFAHELCHILRHSGYQKKMARSFVEYQEWQADHFSYHFCVPTFMLDRLRGITAHGIMNLFNVDYAFACRRLEMYKNNYSHARRIKDALQRVGQG